MAPHGVGLPSRLPRLRPRSKAGPWICHSSIRAPPRPLQLSRSLRVAINGIDMMAGLLALATSIPDAQGRTTAARIFKDLLEEARWSNLFRTWSRLAPSVDCARNLALAIELKRRWDDTPRFWRFRVASNKPTRHHGSVRSQYSWRTSLAVAEIGSEFSAELLLDEDWLDEWEDLGSFCPGFWNFAAYARIRAEGDEAEAAAFRSSISGNRAMRALHNQEFCEHLGSGRRHWNADSGPRLDLVAPSFALQTKGLKYRLQTVPVLLSPPTSDQIEKPGEHQ
jgi:hypothetical protein